MMIEFEEVLSNTYAVVEPEQGNGKSDSTRKERSERRKC